MPQAPLKFEFIDPAVAPFHFLHKLKRERMPKSMRLQRRDRSIWKLAVVPFPTLLSNWLMDCRDIRPSGFRAANPAALKNNAADVSLSSRPRQCSM
jgi:hypothetical protein